jgi:hypothetical protein
MNQNAKSTKRLKRTVLIGLGGTGKKALLHAKKRFLETFGEDPPLVKYLLIDTTSSNADRVTAETPSGRVDVRLKADEILHIEARGASLLPQVHDEIREWFPPKADLKANILSGAGQIRALGRLALFANATIVYENLRDLLALARDYRDERPSDRQKHVYEPYTPHLTVALVGSLAGGTGSGIFLDVAFALRQLMKDEDQLFGYLLLPDIYVNRPGTQNVEANAYAALKELDYFMSREDTYRYSFGGRAIELRKKPFDMVFLVNRQNRAGKTFNEVEDLMELLGLGLYLLGGPLGKEQADTFDNIVHQLNEQKGKYYGKTAHYASFGAAELRFQPQALQQKVKRQQTLEALEKLLHVGYDWEPVEVRKRLDALRTFNKEVAPPQLRAANSRSEDASRWQEAQTTLHTWQNQIEEALWEEWRAGDFRAFIRTEAQQNFAGRSLGNLEEALKRLLQEARQLHNELEQKAKESEEKYNQLVGAIDQKANKADQKGGFLGFGRREDTEPVFTRGRLSSLQNTAKEAALTKGRAKLAEDAVRALEELLRELGTARERIEKYKDGLSRGNDEDLLQKRDKDQNPFTLTLPPAYLKTDGQVQAQRADLHWNLEALLKNPEDEVKQKLDSPSIAFAKWLQESLQRKETDSELWESVERTFREADDISSPAWDYEDAWVSNPGLGYREQVHILGIEDSSNREHPLIASEDFKNLLASNLHDRMRLQAVSTGDNARILFYKIEASIPAFTLRGIGIYREKYRALSEDRSFHIHRHWENNLPDLFPAPSEEQVAQVWTKARALELLSKSEEGYGFVDRRQGTSRRHLLGVSPSQAFEALGKDFFAFKELEAQVKAEEAKRLRDPDKLQNMKNRLPNVIQERRGLTEEPTWDEAERAIFDKELKVLEQWLEYLKTIRPEAGNDDFPAL